MLALVLIAGFPVILAVGFGGLAMASSALGSPATVDRVAAYLYPALLAVPLAAALVVVVGGGLFDEVGLAPARLPSVPSALQVPASLFLGAGAAAVLFYGELAASSLVARIGRRRTALQRALEGKTREFTEEQQAISLPLLLTISVFVAFAEELLWRGFLLHVLPEVFGLGTVGAVLVAAVLFGFNHAYFGVLNVVLKALAGVVWALLLLATGSLLAPVASHYAYEILVWRRVHR